MVEVEVVVEVELMVEVELVEERRDRMQDAGEKKLRCC